MDIKKSFITDKKGKIKSVIVDYKQYKKIEEILLDYGLTKAMEEVEDEENVSEEEIMRILKKKKNAHRV